MAFDIGAWVDTRLQNLVGSEAFKSAIKTAVAEAITDTNVALKADVSQGFNSVIKEFTGLPGQIIQGVLGGLPHIPPFFSEKPREPTDDG
jgi:hypothetical protein